MVKSGERTAAEERSRWLAELAEAVAQAQWLARALGAPAGNCLPAKKLYRRLELIRIEVEDLRRGGWGAHPTEINPEWMSLHSWNKLQKH